MIALKPIAARASIGSRNLAFTNLHTGETLNCCYFAGDTYNTDELARIAKVLRDHRSGEIHPIDNRLLDALHNLRGVLETDKPFHVISGYRSPGSNAKMAAASKGVAKKSMHMDGMAIDIRVPGVDLKHLHKAAKALQAGGVGFYAESNFVHMDVGRVRYW
jgi:uncharacterized protein YcbK (DUF882 family)